MIYGNEGFSNADDNSKNGKLLLSLVITIAIYLVLILFVGRWIWNNVLVKLVSGVNKIKNPIDLLLLSLLFSLLFGTL